MKRRFLSLVLVGLFSAVPFLSEASTHQDDKSVSRPCQIEREKFCKEIKPGEGKIHECMKQHEKELSPECRAKIEKRKDRWESCQSDREKFCKDIKPGDKRIRKCLKEHQSELSSSCQETFKK